MILAPIATLIRQLVLDGYVLQNADTGLRALDEEALAARGEDTSGSMSPMALLRAELLGWHSAGHVRSSNLSRAHRIAV